MATIRRQRDGAAPPEVAGGALLLDAESDWVVEGTPEEISSVIDALGSKTCSRVAERVAVVRFGNNVGRVADTGGLGPLVVRSGKWGEEEFHALLDDLSRIAAALPFASTAPSALPYERSELHTRDVLYHAFVWLQHALLRRRDPELHNALDGIVRSPHRRLARTTREVPVELAGRLGGRALNDIAAGRWPIVESRIGFPADGRRVLPQRVDEEFARESVDTAENRFVKSFLAECVWVVDQIRQQLGRGDDSLSRRVRTDCAALADVLLSWRRAPMWRDVGAMTHFPESSPVLHRRGEYRTVLRHHQQLRLGSRVPLDPEASLRLLESRDVATLYEMWSSFAMIEEVGLILGPPTRTARVVVNAKGAKIEWGLVARWADGTELAYNFTYTTHVGFHGKSRSLRLRPDVAIFVPAGPSAGLHLFDAKFRLTGTIDPNADDETSYQHGDLHKMHAYRDAIATARSAWVLYPGADDVAFLDDGRRSLAALALGSIEGVGALSLRPGVDRGAVRMVIALLVGAVAVKRTEGRSDGDGLVGTPDVALV